MKLLGSYKNKITKDKNGENVPNLEITEANLVHCNIVNNNYQQDSRVLFIFTPNKLFNSEFSYIKVWFTDQNSKPLETEYIISITLVIN